MKDNFIHYNGEKYIKAEGLSDEEQIELLKAGEEKVAVLKKELEETAKEYARSLKEAQELLSQRADSEVFSVVDTWDEITGLTWETIDEMDLDEIVELVSEKLNLNTKKTLTYEMFKSIKPSKYIIPNNKLSNELTKDGITFNEPFNLLVNTKNKIINPAIINYESDDIQILDDNQRFTPYDRAVHNAVCSIFEAGNETFTPDQVYRAMNGLETNFKPSPQAIGAVTKSIDKATKIKVKVDYTNEARAYKKDVDEATVEGYLLLADKITLKAGGHKVMGYKIYRKPVLYEYAQFTNQVLTVPSKLLYTNDVVRTTSENIVIREYLIRRIEVMKGGSGNSNKILFQKVFEEIGQPKPTSKKAMKVRDVISLLLDKYKKDKYIKDYEFQKKGRSFVRIEIIY